MNSNNALLMHNMNHTKTVEKSVDFIDSVELEGTVNAVCKPKVFGNSTQETRSGKNLWNYEYAKDYSNTIMSTYIWVEIKGLKPNTTYTFTADADYLENIQSTYGSGGIAVLTREPSYSVLDYYARWIYHSTWGFKYPVVTFKTDETGKCYLGSYRDGTKWNISWQDYWLIWIKAFEISQFEEGEVATDYEPYGASPSPDFPSPILSTGDEGKIELWARNKNYAPELDKWNLSGGAYIDEEGWIVIPQEGAKAWVDVDWKYVNNIFNITAEFYTNATNNKRLMNTLYYDANGQYIRENGNSVAIQASEITKSRWTVREEIYTRYIKQSWKIRLYIQWHANNSTGEFKFRNVTFNPFDFIDYVKHRSNTIVFPLAEPLRKVGDVADYIDWENKKIVRNIEKRIFNSSDTWTTNASQYSEHTYYLDKLLESNKYIDNRVLCNILQSGGVWNSAIPNRIYIQSSNGALMIRVNKTLIDSFSTSSVVEGWKLFLDSLETDMICIFRLVTPIEEPFNQEQLAVAELMTTQKNCTISVITETKPSKVELNYLKMGVK